MTDPRKSLKAGEPTYKMILRHHYEPIPEGDWRDHILRGWTLRRHVLALKVQRIACWVRGHHSPGYEPDWKVWFCDVCGLNEEDGLRHPEVYP